MCRIEGCDLPNYHYNPLISPLASFHGRLVKTFDTLPENKKVVEVAKRIVVCVAAPLAYLVLGLTALIGLALDGIFVKSHSIREDVQDAGRVSEQRPQPPRGFDQFMAAFGGRDAFERIDVLTEWDGTISPEFMTSPIMRHDHPDKVFVLFHLTKPQLTRDQIPMGRVHYVDVLVWNKHTESLEGAMTDVNDLDLAANGSVAPGSLLEDVIYDRVRRLVTGQYVGYAKRYQGVILLKPENKDEYRPNDAYLEREMLDRFMDENTLRYEVAQEVGGDERCALRLIRR